LPKDSSDISPANEEKLDMSTKFYWSLWTLLVLVTLGLLLAGSLTNVTISIVGMVACLFILMGMMCITPTLVGPHAKEFQHGDAEPVPQNKAEPAPKRIPAGAVIQSRIAH
jgi:hypothetical protein